MSIDRSKLPPQLQELLTKLEASGVKVETGNLEDLLKSGQASSETSDSSENTEANCACPRCVGRRAREAFAKATGIPPGIQSSLDRQAEFLAKKLSENVDSIVEPLRLELRRQVEINDANMVHIAELLTRVNGLEYRGSDLQRRLTDLDERFRKQTSLLHKRVTKRKGEVKDVKVRVAATRGRVTRVEKKLV